jgi:hypothetical protein
MSLKNLLALTLLMLLSFSLAASEYEISKYQNGSPVLVLEGPEAGDIYKLLDVKEHLIGSSSVESLNFSVKTYSKDGKQITCNETRVSGGRSTYSCAIKIDYKGRVKKVPNHF